MKNKIIHWLKTGCDFEQGLNILNGLNHLAHFHRMCKIQGASKLNVQMLEYQLCKHVGITEQQAKIIKKQKIKIAPTKIVEVNTKLKVVEDSQPPKVSEMQVSNSPASEAVVNIERKKLREQYPFLNDKNCPDEFKILVADKISAYNRFVETHPKLMGYKTLEEAGELSKEVIENYLENRLIHVELEHFKKTKKILGKHKIFKQFSQLKTIRTLTTPQLIKHKEKLEMNIWRNKKLIKDEPKNKNNSSRQEKINEYEVELKEVKGLLKIDE